MMVASEREEEGRTDPCLGPSGPTSGARTIESSHGVPSAKRRPSSRKRKAAGWPPSRLVRDPFSLLEDGILFDEPHLAPLVAKAEEAAGSDVGDTDEDHRIDDVIVD
jgi:hypothetical protein